MCTCLQGASCIDVGCNFGASKRVSVINLYVQTNFSDIYRMLLLLIVVSCVLLFSVVISLIRNDFWLFKVFEYPRLQKITLAVITLGCWSFYWPHYTPLHKALIAALIICIFYLAYKIFPYTLLAKKEMLSIKPGDQGHELRIFAANVLQTNTEYDKMLQQIRSCNPDIIFLLETNQAWADSMKSLEEDYPYQLLAPLENTYGLLFYSRLKLEGGKVLYRVKEDIPSIQTKIYLPSGKPFYIWGLHPEPPVPGENRYSTAKDKELMKVALEVRECDHPCFVFGDLNDVAWSYTTELFRKTSGLLDPRRGRGFYSTFSAHHWFVRFPLDYIFCSEHFGLVQMKRLPKNGSDHFATFTHLAFHPELKEQQSAPEADKEEIQEAKKMAAQAVKE